MASIHPCSLQPATIAHGSDPAQRTYFSDAQTLELSTPVQLCATEGCSCYTALLDETNWQASPPLTGQPDLGGLPHPPGAGM